MLPVEVLGLKVVPDGILLSALSFESAERDILKEPPRSPEESIFDKTLIRKIIYSGAVIGILVYAVWRYLINVAGLDTPTAQGIVLCTSDRNAFALWRSLNCAPCS